MPIAHPALDDIIQPARLHHQDNPIGADSEPIDDGELLTYVNRTLAFVAS